MAKFDYRFVVASPTGSRSSPWHVRRSGNHLYVLHSGMGAVQKFSFHPPDICRLAETKEFAHQRGKRREATHEWQRLLTPPRGEGQRTKVLQISIGTNTLSLSYGAKGLSKKSNTIPSAPFGHTTNIEVCFTRETQEAVERLLEASEPYYHHRVLAYDMMPSGEAALITTFNTNEPNDTLDMPAPTPGHISRWGHLVVSPNDPANTGRPIRVTVFSNPGFGDFMQASEFGAYEVAN
jgi:hypothetical protein